MSNDPVKRTVAKFEHNRQGLLPSALVPLILATGAALGGIAYAIAAYFDVVGLTWENAALAAGIGTVITLLVAKSLGNRAHRKFNRNMVRKINESVLELTGDHAQKLSLAQVRLLLEEKRSMPLTINGISGIEATVETIKSSRADDYKSVVFRVAENDDAGGSFDHLVINAAKKNPDIHEVISLYPQDI